MVSPYSNGSLLRMTIVGLLVFSGLMITDYLIFGFDHAMEMSISAIGCALAFAALVRLRIL